GYMLLYIDKQVYSLFNSVVVLILSIVSIPLFISFFGVLGASFGVLLSILSGNFLEKLQFDYFRRNRKYLNYYE
ncbi:hypothetical protein EAY12_22165, partial [Vibrio anguillarum]|nr:hypothetical protein [Vibrio anguillarum]